MTVLRRRGQEALVRKEAPPTVSVRVGALVALHGSWPTAGGIASIPLLLLIVWLLFLTGDHRSPASVTLLVSGAALCIGMLIGVLFLVPRRRRRLTEAVAEELGVPIVWADLARALQQPGQVPVRHVQTKSGAVLSVCSPSGRAGRIDVTVAAPAPTPHR